MGEAGGVLWESGGGCGAGGVGGGVGEGVLGVLGWEGRKVGWGGEGMGMVGGCGLRGLRGWCWGLCI